MFRVRRLSKPRIPFPRYEVDYTPQTGNGWHRVTRFPVYRIERVLSVAEARALVKAANARSSSSDRWATHP